MQYLLELDLCVRLIKGRHAAALQRKLKGLEAGAAAVSSITLAELACGVARSRLQRKNARALATFLEELEVLPFDAAAAQAYGTLLACFPPDAAPLPYPDMMTAAHAISTERTLATLRATAFKPLEGLQVEHW